jgi:uncharacterized repeat protein (TIGR01451 family)
MISVVALVMIGLVASLFFTDPSVVKGAPLAQGTPPPRQPINPTPTSSSAATTTTQPNVALESEITLAMVVDKDMAQPGDTLHYRVQVTNVGGKEATNIWLTCDLPEEVEVQESSTTQGTVHAYGQRISFELGRFAPAHESQIVTIVARIREEVKAGTELVGHANLTSDQAGGGEHSVTTVIEGERPITIQEILSLPTTGGGTIPFWMALGFLVMIVVVGLYTARERMLSQER